MTLLELALVPLAVHAVGVTWFRGSLFEPIHEQLRARAVEHSGLDEGDLPDDVMVVTSPWWGPFVSRCPRLLAELVTCPRCLRRHIVLWGAGLWFLCQLHPFAMTAAQLLLRGLAVLGAADLLWDLGERHGASDDPRATSDDQDPAA